MSKTVIEELLEEMERNVGLLEELKSESLSDFVSNPRNYLMAERCFQLAIQCLIDIAYYLAAQNRWTKPESASDAVKALGEHQVLDRDFSAKIVGMANFRNILVHAYLQIDRTRVYKLLDELDDFKTFARQIITYLERD